VPIASKESQGGTANRERTAVYAGAKEATTKRPADVIRPRHRIGALRSSSTPLWARFTTCPVREFGIPVCVEPVSTCTVV